jgi:hypothetical protein
LLLSQFFLEPFFSFPVVDLVENDKERNDWEKEKARNNQRKNIANFKHELEEENVCRDDRLCDIHLLHSGTIMHTDILIGQKVDYLVFIVSLGIDVVNEELLMETLSNNAHHESRCNQ